MAATTEPNSFALARESKTFTTNAQRTPETTRLVVRALEAYSEHMATWLETHTDQALTTAWTICYDEWRATKQTLKLLEPPTPPQPQHLV